MKFQDLKNSKPSWWRWNNFLPTEVSCRHCGEIWLGESDEPPVWFMSSMDALQKLRDLWGAPIILSCGHRCEKHNREVGGVSSPDPKRDSQHHVYIAFDCLCQKADQLGFERLARQAGFKYVQRYPDKGFVHVDMRIGK